MHLFVLVLEQLQLSLSHAHILFEAKSRPGSIFYTDVGGPLCGVGVGALAAVPKKTVQKRIHSLPGIRLECPSASFPHAGRVNYISRKGENHKILFHGPAQYEAVS